MNKRKKQVLEREFLVLKPITKEKTYNVGSTIKLSNAKQIEFLTNNNFIK